MGCSTAQSLKVEDRIRTVDTFGNNRNVMYLVLFLFSALGHLFHSSSVFAKENCVLYTNVFIENRLDKRQSVTILAEVADEPDERAIGLMNRTKIGKTKVCYLSIMFQVRHSFG